MVLVSLLLFHFLWLWYSFLLYSLFISSRQNIIVRRGSHGRIRRNGGKRLHLIEQRQTIDTPRLRAVESPYTQLRTGFERMIIHPHHPVMPEHLMKQLRFQTGVHHHQQFVTGILHNRAGRPPGKRNLCRGKSPKFR